MALAAAFAVWRWRFSIRKILSKAFRHEQFKEHLATFFVEAAVLWFVFPVLDTFVEFGGRKITAGLGAISIAVAIVCMFIAGILSNKDVPGK